MESRKTGFEKLLPFGIENSFRKILLVAFNLISRKFTHWEKDDFSLVTSLDFEIQRQIIEIIAHDFPQHRILYEEGDQFHEDKKSGYTWIIDPIDGTQNFILGKNWYSISVGLMYMRKFIAALVIFPGINECYSSLQELNIRSYSTSIDYNYGSGKIKEVILCSKSYPILKNKLNEIGIEPICYNCATFSMLKVLKGDALFYYTINTNLYDVGPMSFILALNKIRSFDERFKTIRYNANLKKIPFFVCAQSLQSLKILRC